MKFIEKQIEDPRTGAQASYYGYVNPYTYAGGKIKATE